jgi:hypothetical protein
MTPLRQPLLPLSVPATAALVDIHTARIHLGVDEDSVLALVESGGLRWAWDIGSRPSRQIREVRIWVRCLAARQAGEEQPSGTPLEVARAVLGVEQRARMRATEVRQLFCCSQQTVQRLVERGVLRGQVVARTLWVERESLEGFLCGRLLK